MLLEWWRGLWNMSDCWERWEFLFLFWKNYAYWCELFLKFLRIILFTQLPEVLVEMGSNLMQVDDQILSLAQREKKACSSIVYSLEMLAWPHLHSHAQDFTMVQTSTVIFHSCCLPEPVWNTRIGSHWECAKKLFSYRSANHIHWGCPQL